MSAKRFDELAAAWDNEPQHRERAMALAQALTRLLPLSKDMKVLECGAGTGLLAAFLAPRVGHLLATDSSSGMLQALEKNCQALENVAVRSFDPSCEVLDEAFYLIVAAMLLHHIENTEKVLHHFHAMLEPGGWLALADLDEEDGSFHGDMPQVAHHGFNRKELQRLLEASGFGGIRMETAHHIEKNGRTYPVFLAVAQRT